MKANKLHIALITAMSTLILSPNINAADITIETYVEGGLTMSVNGDYSTGIYFSDVAFAFTDTESTWDSDSNVDYIDFADDTSTAGFEISISNTPFRYTGESTSQADLAASNLKVYGQYNNGTPSAATKDYDNPDANVSILPESCGNSTTGSFSFNPDFSDSQKNYAVSGSETDVVLISSSSDCLNLGHLRFDRISLVIPQSSAIGGYLSTITFTASDGI